MASPFDCIKRVAGAQCWGIGLVCVQHLRNIPERHECKKLGQCIFTPKQPAQPADVSGVALPDGAKHG